MMSNAAKAPELQTLAQRNSQLSSSIDTWNAWYVWFGAAALLVAFLVFFSQWRIIRKSKELALVQSDLIATKDRQAALDSRDQDERIAIAQMQAADSNRAAGKANEAAKQADERAQKAQASLALAEQHSAEANAKAEGFRANIAEANASAAKAQAQIADARQAAAEANKIAESEKLARLQLEARLADRVISPNQLSRITQAFEPLRGQTVDVVIIGSSLEVTKTSDAILNSIVAAGVPLNYAHPIAAAYAQGIIVGLRKDASAAQRQACSSLISILVETLGSGVGRYDFDKISVQITGTNGSTPGAAPMGQSPLRLVIAPK